MSAKSRPPSPDEKGNSPDGGAGAKSAPPRDDAAGADAPGAPGKEERAPAADKSARRLVLTPASEIDPEPVVWAWEDGAGADAGRIPAGSLGLFAGREGTGKSSFLIWMAAQITTGKLPGSFYGKPRAVIYVAVEDSWKYTIVPRLMAAGANRKLVYRAEVQVMENTTVSLSLPMDNELLEDAITTYDVAMVALDPLMSAISDTLDTHVNRQVRQALDPLARIADRTGAIFAGIAHFNKSGGTDASSLVTGSGAFKDVARFIFAFAADPEDNTQVITQTKNSLGRSDLPSLAYRIISATVPTTKGNANVGRFVLDGESERSVEDILSVQSGGNSERDEKTRAVEYLKKALASGMRRTREVEEEAREVHGLTRRTLERARKDLRVATERRASGAIKAGKRAMEWWMALAEHAGDLTAAYEEPAEPETPSPAETPETGDEAKIKTAKTAKAASPGALGGLGGLDTPEPCCDDCGTAVPGPSRSLTGITLCDQCLDARAARQRESRQAAGDQSACQDCGGVIFLEDGKLTCSYCHSSRPHEEQPGSQPGGNGPARKQPRKQTREQRHGKRYPA